MFPLAKPYGITNWQIPRCVAGAEMTFQNRDIRFFITHEFCICPVGHTVTFTIIPQESIFIVGNFYWTFTRIFSSSSSIAGWPVFFEVIGCVGSHGPVMTIGTNFSVDIKIIEQYKFAGESMLVRCDIFTKKNQITIAISFRYISQHLVIRAVLLNNVKDIPYRWFISHFHGDRIACCSFGFQFCVLVIRGVIINSLWKKRHLARIRRLQNCKCSPEKSTYILFFNFLFLPFSPENHDITFTGRIRSIRICMRW